MSELRACQVEGYKKERKNLTDADGGLESLGNEDGSESGSGKKMVYGNEMWRKETERCESKSSFPSAYESKEQTVEG